MSFFEELKRRNVFRVGIAYAVAAWVLLQIVDLVLDNIAAPDWVMQVFMLALAVGFPIAIIIAWAFEVTPEGVKLEKNVDRSQSIARETGKQLNRGIIVILSVAVVFLLTERFREQAPGSDALPTKPAETTRGPEKLDLAAAQKPVAQKSIAVLPFRDMSATGDQGYFGEGIAEELLNGLVRLDKLKVASRTSSFALADEDLDVPAIARRLDVTNILEGSVRTAGNKVRVTAQLIDVKNDVHLWSQTYDGSLDDIFGIQDKITRQIIEALRVQLTGGGPAPTAQRLTANPQAYQLYLQGRHLWRQRNAAALQEAIRIFKQATELDPHFHQAWSNLAIAYLNLPDYDSSVDSEDSFTLGLAAADKALAIAPRSTEALIIKASYQEWHCDLAGAAGLYEKAIAFNPEEPTAHHWYALMLSGLGRQKMALEQIQVAYRIDPMISAVVATQGQVFELLGDFTLADQLFRQASALGFDEDTLIGSASLRLLYAGQTRQAVALMQQKISGAGTEDTKTRKLFAAAVENPDAQQTFEQYLGKADANLTYQTVDNSELLALLGSAYLMSYQAGLACPKIPAAVWSEPFREQRHSAKFFDLMERASFVTFWKKYGWPDDCASLDPTLAECP